MTSFSAAQTAPARSWKAVAPSDVAGTALAAGCRGLYVGSAGNLALVDDAGNTEIFLGVAAGTTLPLGPTRVLATGTTATGIIALY